MKILVDSSVFIAFFNTSDVFHKTTVALFEKLSEDKDTTNVFPILVFLEVVNVLYKRLGEFDEKSILRTFIAYETIDVTFELAQSFLSVFKQVTLKTSDAIVVATAKLTDATLITCDEQLLAKAKKFIKAQTPNTFLA